MHPRRRRLLVMTAIRGPQTRAVEIANPDTRSADQSHCEFAVDICSLRTHSQQKIGCPRDYSCETIADRSLLQILHCVSTKTEAFANQKCLLKVQACGSNMPQHNRLEQCTPCREVA
jgi:hypothetical protein